MIRLTASSFIIHKEAESPDDCQDAYAQNDAKGRYAIADGATRSFFPREWATLLVEHFRDNLNFSLAGTDWLTWIAPIQQEWYEQVDKKVKGRNLFYLTNSFNAQESAVSTFIGIEFNKDNSTWEAVIVGDSCLFHKSNSEFNSYLIENSADFTNQPEVFASFPKDNQVEPTFILASEAKPGDTFFLATDALAKWILEHKETEKLDAALNTLEAIETDEQFHQFVDNARHDESIRLVNDDVTLMLISVEENQRPEGIGPEAQTQEQTQRQRDVLSLIFLWGILAGVVAFFVGVIMFFLMDTR